MALIAPRGGFALVASAAASAEARDRALARQRSAMRRSQAICEDLAEHLSWLRRPDDADPVAEVVTRVRDGAAALQLCVGRLPAPVWHVQHPVLEELAAIVDAIDAEVRLAIMGQHTARARARHLTALLRATAATLACEGAA